MVSEWNTGVEVELPLPSHRKSIGLENGVMELLWQNGEVVLNKQKSSCKCHDNDDDEETASWIHCPIDEAFEKEFCSNLIFSDEIAPPNPMTSLPPPRLIIPSRNHSRKGPGESMSTIGGGSSHCGSNNNQVEKSHGPRGRRFRLMQVSDKKKNIIISSQSKTTSTELQPITTSSTKRKISRDHEMEDQSECQSDAPESEELATGNKVMSSQKSGTTRRSRVAQVHNLSERRRRDRINEKMKALQELIPDHSNKQSDKASMLDEAIEYMKSLQLQLQLMWNMGSTGMAARPPLMMHQYAPAVLLMQQYQYMMSSLMARPTPTPTPIPTLPQIQNHLMRFLSPPNNNNNQPTQNHHSNSSTMFNHDHNQYANNYNINTFHPMQNTSTSHPVNMFNLGAQQNHHHHVLAQPNIGNNMDLPS